MSSLVEIDAVVNGLTTATKTLPKNSCLWIIDELKNQGIPIIFIIAVRFVVGLILLTSDRGTLQDLRNKVVP